MPLRNERQAYWDDIDAAIASVPPRTGAEALDRVCPDAAADRAALLARLGAVDAERAALERARDRAVSHARVLDRETDALARLRVADEAALRAERFVRGRLENDRVAGQRPGAVPAPLLPRADAGRVPRGFDPPGGAYGGGGTKDPEPHVTRAAVGASGRLGDPRSNALRHREANERWGGAGVSPLMGGGYTVVLERARLDAEAAADELAAKRRERQLYFMSDEDDDGSRGETAERGDFGEGGAFDRLRVSGKENASEKINRNRRCPEGAAGALRGWAPAPGDDERSSSGLLSASGRNGAGSLPPPRGVTSGGVSAEAPSSSGGGGGEPTTTRKTDDATPRRSTLGGTRASARLSMIHAGGSAPSAASRAPGSFARGATPGLLR
jgi:hypothetical protein